MIYIEHFFHISLMENRDGILTEEGKKAKENRESNTYTLCKSTKHLFQNKKRIERKINLTDFLLFSFHFLKKSSGTRKYQQLTFYSKEQCKYILMYITGQLILKNPWLSVSMAFLLWKGPHGNLLVGIHIMKSQMRAPKQLKLMDLYIQLQKVATSVRGKACST